jgi:hypothetical protein
MSTMRFGWVSVISLSALVFACSSDISLGEGSQQKGLGRDGDAPMANGTCAAGLLVCGTVCRTSCAEQGVGGPGAAADPKPQAGQSAGAPAGANAAPGTLGKPGRNMIMTKESICGVRDGIVRCMGDDWRGSLGTGNKVLGGDGLVHQAAMPVAAASMLGGGAAGSSCAISGTNALYCWGPPSVLAPGKFLVPAPVLTALPDLGAPITEIYAIYTDALVCALTTADMFCWGKNSNGQLGQGNVTPYSEPVKIKIPGAGRIVKAGVGGSSACALDDAGKLYCWGNVEKKFRSEEPENIERSIPEQIVVPTGEAIVDIAHSASTFCFTTTSKSVYCYDEGPKTGPRIPVVVPFPAGETVARITSGISGTRMAQMESGKLFCWGNNSASQCLPTTTTKEIPYPVALDLPAGFAVENVYVGWANICIENKSLERYCRGSNVDAQLGREVAGQSETKAGFFQSPL